MNIIGIDLGGTKILGIRTGKDGRILDEVREPTHADEGMSAVVDRIVSLIRRLTPDGGVDAIGIGAPGPLSHLKGEVYDPPNLPNWENVPLIRLVRERLGLDDRLPVVLINDANAAALAEYKYGAGSEKKLGR
jgi:glucokinase